MKRYAYLVVPALMGAALSGVPVHAAARHATLGEFATPTQASSPQGVDIARDGSVWYSETSAGKIAVLHPDKTSAEYPLPNGGQPFILKVGRDGIWFTDSATHAIGHLDPDSGKVTEYAIPSGASPFFIQIAPDGSKWFSETAGVGRLSPSGVITEWSVTLEHADDNIEQLSLDPFGRVWFAERNFDGGGAAGTNKVRRLNPLTHVISTYLVPTFGGNPAGVLANANGTVWVSEYYANALALLNPLLAPHTDEVVQPNTLPANNQMASVSSTVTGPDQSSNATVPPDIHTAKPSVTQGWIEYPIPAVDAEAEDMRVDRHGRVWFEEDKGLLGRLDPRTARFSEYTIPSPDSGYYNIVLDQKADALWFTEAGVFAQVPTKIGYLHIP